MISPGKKNPPFFSLHPRKKTPSLSKKKLPKNSLVFFFAFFFLLVCNLKDSFHQKKFYENHRKNDFQEKYNPCICTSDCAELLRKNGNRQKQQNTNYAVNFFALCVKLWIRAATISCLEYREQAYFVFGERSFFFDDSYRWQRTGRGVFSVFVDVFVLSHIFFCMLCHFAIKSIFKKKN